MSLGTLSEKDFHFSPQVTCHCKFSIQKISKKNTANIYIYIYLQWFSMVVSDLQWFSMVVSDLQWFLQ